MAGDWFMGNGESEAADTHHVLDRGREPAGHALATAAQREHHVKATRGRDSRGERAREGETEGPAT